MEYLADWQKYEAGKNYKTKSTIDLYNRSKKCERFFSGDQWNGVVSNGLPTPVLNIIKRIIMWKVSQIMSQNIKYQYSIMNIPDEPENEMQEKLKDVQELISDYSLTLAEKVSQDWLNEKILYKGAITGTSLLYDYYSPSKKDIVSEIINSVDYYPDDPNEPDVQKQDGIILAYRESVKKVKKEAKENKQDPEKIISDQEYEYKSGYLNETELDSQDDGKCTVLLKLWKDENGVVWSRKSTKNGLVRDNTESKCKRYTLALFTWEEREGSCFGESDCWQLIPNQIAINKLLAMNILSTMNTAYPKMIYDQNLVQNPSNQVGAAIAVNGSDKNLDQVVKFTQTGQISTDVYKVIDILIQQTKEMNGATEVAMGEVRPENTSAFIAVNQASTVPLESVQRRFYKFQKDIALNRLDLMLNYYNTSRQLMVTRNGQRVVAEINLSEFADQKFDVKVDVGPSSRWSEIASLQTLDKLLEQEKITFLEWLERVPKGVLPKLNELIEARKEQEAIQESNNALQFVSQLPPEEQMKIDQLPTDEAKIQYIQALMQRSGQVA